MKVLWNFGVNKYICSPSLVLTKISGLMNNILHRITELFWSIPLISTQHVSTSAARLHVIQILAVLRNLMGKIMFIVTRGLLCLCIGFLIMTGLVQRLCSDCDTFVLQHTYASVIDPHNPCNLSGVCLDIIPSYWRWRQRVSPKFRSQRIVLHDTNTQTVYSSSHVEGMTTAHDWPSCM
jgi:hypothetical protein